MLIFIAVGLFLILGFKFLSSAENSAPKVNTNSNPVEVEHAQFIRKVAPQAQKLQGQYNILPSITIAQAILESNWGTSQLSQKYNNLFGVKANGNLANSVYLNTQEFVNGKYVTVKARFQVYKSWNDSLTDHARLLRNGTQWNGNQYSDVINASNYRQGALALQKDGYATDPAYTQKLIYIIRTYKLYQYDS